MHDQDDREYSSIAFDVRTTTLLPVDCVTIRSIWICGKLGSVSIFATPRTCRWRQYTGEGWRLVYSGEHRNSTSLKEMVLDEPVTISCGEGVGLCVHCSFVGSDDLCQGRPRPFRSLKIFPEPSIAYSPFGRSSSSWREAPEFVARLGVEVEYTAWSPGAHLKFPQQFRSVAFCLLASFRRLGLSRDIVAAVLSACHCEWWSADVADCSRTSLDDSRRGIERSRRRQSTRESVRKRKRKLRLKMRQSLSSRETKRRTHSLSILSSSSGL